MLGLSAAFADAVSDKLITLFLNQWCRNVNEHDIQFCVQVHQSGFTYKILSACSASELRALAYLRAACFYDYPAGMLCQAQSSPRYCRGTHYVHDANWPDDAA